jgi:Membrane dipeptidase (Peptidase family M19)
MRKFYEDRTKRGLAAPGEAPDVFNLIPEYNSPRRFRTLADDLSRRGWPAARIDKILGANFARVFGSVWSAYVEAVMGHFRVGAAFSARPARHPEQHGGSQERGRIPH